MNSYRIGFMLEQTLGHITHTRNLQANVLRDQDVQPYWGLIPYHVSGFASHVPPYGNWSIRAGLRTRRKLAEIAQIARLDALFFHTQVPAVLAVDWVRRVPSVISLDATPEQYDVLGASYGHSRGSEPLERLKWFVQRTSLVAARALVTWSEWARRGVITGYGVEPDKVAVIPPGVTVRDWMRPESFSRPEGPLRVLFVGADFARKGGPLLLEAARALRAANLPIELHLVTREVLPSEHGVFVYNNMEPNSALLKRLYHESDIFCLPTLGDCLPMVLSEAGASGMPLISTRVAAIPEIVRDGETGLLIPPNDVPALATALRRLVEDDMLRRRLGANATALVLREYDAERNTRKLLDVLKLVADTAHISPRRRLAA